MRRIFLYFFLVFSPLLSGMEKKPSVLFFHSPANRRVNVTFDLPNLYAVCQETGEKFYPKDRTISLTLLSSTNKREKTHFQIYSIGDNKGLGEITFRYTPDTLPDVVDSYTTCIFSDFDLPMSSDRVDLVPQKVFPEEDQKALWNAIEEVAPEAYAFLLGYKKIKNPTKEQSIRAALQICYFIWECSPNWSFRRISRELPFKKRISILKRGDYSFLCGGLSNMFSDFLSIIMPETPHRIVKAVNHDLSKSNLHIDSHMVVELNLDGHWCIVDPSLQLIFLDPQGELMNGLGLREYKSKQKLDQISVWCLETADLTKTALYTTYLPFDVSGRTGYFASFNCLSYIEFARN